MTPATPISLDDVLRARETIADFMPPSPLRHYPELDDWVGHGIRVHVKHENFNPTGAFKVRNGLSFVAGLSEAERARGLVAATRGNHGLGVAFAARAFGASCTVCVPVGNNPEKNAGIRALGATVHEEGADFDVALALAMQMQDTTGAVMAHSVNHPRVLAGAATLSLEMIEQEPGLDAIVMGLGGGSQLVGAITVARARKPGLAVYAMQAEGASAGWDSWHNRERRTTARADTFADGLATRATYDLSFPLLLEGLSDFVTATDAEIAEAMRVLMRTTHSMVEGAGAGGLAGLRVLAPRLAGQSVGIVISGGNVDQATLRRVLGGEI